MNGALHDRMNQQPSGYGDTSPAREEWGGSVLTALYNPGMARSACAAASDPNHQVRAGVTSRLIIRFSMKELGV